VKLNNTANACQFIVWGNSVAVIWEATFSQTC